MDVEVEARSDMSIVENVYKNLETVESDRHVNTNSIAQELKID